MLYSSRKDVTALKKLPVGIRHFALDSLRNLKMWYYAVIDKPVPVPMRDDYDASEHVKYLIEFSTPAEIERRRRRLIQICKLLCLYFVLPVLAGLTVVFITQNTATR